MNELAAALRQFADRIERGEALPDASQCALVLGDDAGNAQATYIGRYVPVQRAGTDLLAKGILKLNREQKIHQEELPPLVVVEPRPPAPPDGFGRRPFARRGV